jgi:O-6-methylguanine DNA methyltransferase
MARPQGSFETVWQAVRQIPAGSVASYADIADAALGTRRAARTVGWALSSCPSDVPWWRVIRADGRLPGIRDDLQARLLRAEGFSRYRASLPRAR